ncbi:MAG: tripartite tricarboxylate transporter TctB family protein [Alphaproteobacteria bacterium]
MSRLIDNSRLYISAFGFVAALTYGAAASRLSIPAFSDPIGPRLFPYMVTTGLLIASLCLVIEHLNLRQPAGEAAHEEKEDRDGITKFALIALGMLAIYYLVFEYLGFLVASTLFLLAFLNYSSRGKTMTNIIVALLFPIAAYFLLDTLFGARLPAGILDFG